MPIYLGYFFDIAIFNILAIPALIGVTKDRWWNSRIQCVFYASLLFIFCLYPIYSSDFYSYKNLCEQSSEYIVSAKGVEFLYLKLMGIIGHNYILFRIIVWGGALFFLILTMKNLRLYNVKTLSIFSVISLPFYAYPRVSLGLSLAFWGYSFLIMEKKRMIKIIFGLLIILSTYFFHKSMYLLFPILFISIFKVNRYLVLSIFILLLIFCVSSYSNFLMEKILLYNNDTYTIEKNLGGGKKLLVLCLHLTLFSLLIPLFKDNLKSGNLFYIKNLTFYMLLTSLLLLIKFGYSALYYRFLYMSFIPISLYISEKIVEKDKYFRFLIIFFFLLSNLWILYHGPYTYSMLGSQSDELLFYKRNY